jgi:hypothetical protein
VASPFAFLDDRARLSLLLAREPTSAELDRYRRRRSQVLLRHRHALRRRAARLITRL